ncbi:hypothetical protein PN36_28555 [Candidatus Thiomargarita nelsonii]|uniref:Uncharacterized protein n=1 Tax=Candidatus Thiomargarita nelsonii TaxID=1003181 RepID=A0A0A6RQE2_9GAMM|nr:hypothetical protein PN36_28555 [Candidatus Thiomargarita nelsonii]
MPDKIQQHESEIRQMIYGSLTENQRQLMKTVLANFKQKGYYDVDKSDNIDIIQQMIEVTKMYRGNEELVRVESLQRGLRRGLQQGEEITSLKWFLRGRLEFTDLAEELGEQKALLVQQNAENFKSAMEKGTSLAKLLEQLDEKGEG